MKLVDKNYFIWVLSVLIVALQLLIPPIINETFYYLLFILVFIFLNSGYLIFRKKFRIPNPIEKIDLRFTGFILNTISFASFFYFFFVHNQILSRSGTTMTEMQKYRYEYREVSYFMTKADYIVINFWEISIIILVLSSLFYSIVFYRKPEKKGLLKT
jgi:amino acid transporter